MVMGGAVETLRHIALHWPVSKRVHDVVHRGKLTLPPPLGTLPQFVPVVLDLRLVSQRHLQEYRKVSDVRNILMVSSQGATHLCVDLLGEGGARLGMGVWRARSRLHGDQLYLVGLPSGAIGRAA